MAGSPTGLADWVREGHELAAQSRDLAWRVGDWWNRGEPYGERAQIVSAPDWTGPTYQTCRDYGSIAARFPVSSRDYSLTLKHYRTVAPLSDGDATRLLRWCAETTPPRPTSMLLNEVRLLRQEAKAEAPTRPDTVTAEPEPETTAADASTDAAPEPEEPETETATELENATYDWVWDPTAARNHLEQFVGGFGIVEGPLTWLWSMIRVHHWAAIVVDPETEAKTLLEAIGIEYAEDFAKELENEIAAEKRRITPDTETPNLPRLAGFHTIPVRASDTFFSKAEQFLVNVADVEYIFRTDSSWDCGGFLESGQYWFGVHLDNGEEYRIDVWVLLLKLAEGVF